MSSIKMAKMLSVKTSCTHSSLDGFTQNMLHGTTACNVCHHVSTPTHIFHGTNLLDATCLIVSKILNCCMTDAMQNVSPC